MVYTHDLKSCGASLVGSSPTPGTTLEKSNRLRLRGRRPRPNRTEFSGQKEIHDSVKYGSSRCFSEMLSFRKDFLMQSNSRLDSMTLRTHEPVRAKTFLFAQSQ